MITAAAPFRALGVDMDSQLARPRDGNGGRGPA
jgi:hypothetical protein